jgi:hypothetical protein
MKKALIAAASAIAIVTVFFAIVGHVPKEQAKQASQGPGITLFQGIGSSGSPDSKSVEFTVPGRKTFGGLAGGRLDLEGLTVAQYVEKYRAKARGDAQAAFRLYQAEAICAHIDQSIRKARVMEGSQREQSYRQIADDEVSVCTDATPALILERHQFLEQAAQAGIDEAKIAYLMEGAPGWREGEPIPPDWAKTAQGYLESAAANGNQSALYWLSQAYQQGALGVQKDPQRSLAYTIASFALRPDGDSIDLNNLPLVQRSELSPDQRAAAIAQGKSIAAQAKARRS